MVWYVASKYVIYSSKFKTPYTEGRELQAMFSPLQSSEVTTIALSGVYHRGEVFCRGIVEIFWVMEA
jgi:hypothetical protein